ncbi:outer membrane lipoprotein-sorting protein [Zooshikella ganghwensis]|uniref:Outer membrane lipoprotein-sorting protein n=1 Tax=Zooshikella ganghwensis TaxID=202772 RepID=A0A4P9VVM1_9GAMM|nr:outer membrane lipoprotein-sorting protein [Zooshikella ganghwensis]RDH46412.1 outer membrane lipoprotein-sorting protein [Zooshikella ganghwensis]
MKLKKWQIGTLCLLFITHVLWAKTNSQQGFVVAQKAEQKRKGFNDSQADVTMVLRNAQGEESKRDMVIFTQEVDNDGDKVLIRFLSPGDVKGTALLNYTHKIEDDERWLFLPSIKRVKRLASKNKSGPFMGSEFSYEDLSSPELEKYEYRYLKDEVLNGVDCFVVERIPKDKFSGYIRQEVWYDKEAYRIRKINYIDRKQTLLKTQINSGFKLFSGEFWRPLKVAMVNHQTGKSTELLYNTLTMKVGLEKTLFKPSGLKRLR